MPKSKHQVPGRVRSAYAFIKANRQRYSVQMMCRVLEVAPSGYYEWLQQPIATTTKRMRGCFGYGTQRLAEGGEIADRRLLVVEDVVTSGGQVPESARALRGLSAHVSAAVCVVDREAGGRELLEADGIRLHSLFRMKELVGATALV